MPESEKHTWYNWPINVTAESVSPNTQLMHYQYGYHGDNRAFSTIHINMHLKGNTVY